VLSNLAIVLLVLLVLFVLYLAFSKRDGTVRRLVADRMPAWIHAVVGGGTEVTEDVVPVIVQAVLAGMVKVDNELHVPKYVQVTLDPAGRRKLLPFIADIRRTTLSRIAHDAAQLARRGRLQLRPIDLTIDFVVGSAPDVKVGYEPNGIEPDSPDVQTPYIQPRPSEPLHPPQTGGAERGFERWVPETAMRLAPAAPRTACLMINQVVIARRPFGGDCREITVGRGADCLLKVPPELTQVSRLHLVLQFDPVSEALAAVDHSYFGTVLASAAGRSRLTPNAATPFERGDQFELGDDVWVVVE
jgi:hypothetical protein